MIKLGLGFETGKEQGVGIGLGLGLELKSVLCQTRQPYFQT